MWFFGKSIYMEIADIVETPYESYVKLCFHEIINLEMIANHMKHKINIDFQCKLFFS